MTAISVSPDFERLQTTPPAARITLASAMSRIFVATLLLRQLKRLAGFARLETFVLRWSLAITRLAVEFFYKIGHVPLDFISDLTDVFDWKILGVSQVPIDVALAGKHRTRVTAAHRHHHVRPAGQLICHALRH